MSNNRKERNFKYLVWFGDCDYKEYYFEYEKAKKSYNNCIAEGYTSKRVKRKCEFKRVGKETTRISRHTTT